MDSEILVDTSALIAFFIQSERYHIRAKRYFIQHSEQTWVILSTVFDETVTWMRTRVSPVASIQVGEILRTEHRYIVLSEEDDLATWTLFCQFCFANTVTKAGATRIVLCWP
jgi:predicted nucleic acid-binding protein